METTPPPSSPAPNENVNVNAPDGDLKTLVVATLRTVFDPEIPVNIYDMGMIYEVAVKEDASVDVRMTLTSPSCPVAGSLPPEVQAKIAAIPGVAVSRVELVWEPPWTPEMMSEAAKLQLNMM
jgi:FeS assembly SUF system protein